jgi:type IV pilus assembly protein PilM
MSFLNHIAHLVKDPPPSHIFELSEAGIAFANGDATEFAPLEPGSLVVSPVEDNIHRAESITNALKRLAPLNSARKRRPAVVILPDYAARVSVLDFDSFPASQEERLALIRFRLKKTLPFDIESAAVSYVVQPAAKGAKIEVVAVTVALEIIARYEALFRGMSFHPGEITTSSLAALNLYHGAGHDDPTAVIAKLSGHVLTVMVLHGGTLKLFRCVLLEQVNEEEILSVLHPTLAYVEDELGTALQKVYLCGFPADALADVPFQKEILRSRWGTPGPYNAGLLGYLEGAQN